MEIGVYLQVQKMYDNIQIEFTVNGRIDVQYNFKVKPELWRTVKCHSEPEISPNAPKTKISRCLNIKTEDIEEANDDYKAITHFRGRFATQDLYSINAVAWKIPSIKTAIHNRLQRDIDRILRNWID